MTAYTYTPTAKETAARCTKYGYTFNPTPEAIRARPRGDHNESPRMIVAESRRVLMLAVQAAAVARFAELVNALPEKVDGYPIPAETRAALVAWYESHGTAWIEELSHAWYSGNYGYGCNTSHILQRLRNTNGHEVLALFGAY